MKRVRKALNRWLGRGEASITTPPMDGAFRPNDLLDGAASVLEVPAPDDLAITGAGLVVSSGRSLLRVNTTGDAPTASFDANISALAGLPDGGAAVGLVDGRIVFAGGRHHGKTIAARTDVRCITSLAAAADGALLVANGSATYGPADWKRDLMEKGAFGSVWRLEPASGAWTQIAAGLAYPNGLLDDGDSIVVSEGWRCALTRISPGADGRGARVLEDLPGLSEPAVEELGRNGVARAIRAAQPARRVCADRRQLSPSNDRRDRRRLLGGALPSFRQVPTGADTAGRRQAAGSHEAVVAQPVLWPHRAS